MKKMISLALIAVLTAGLLSGCGNNNEPAPAATPSPSASANNAGGENTTPPEETTDAITTASIVNDPEAFLKAISKDGTWIIAALNDLTFDQELVLEGEFKNKDVVDRKIALYTQDENRKITASFKLTAPKLTIKSPNARLQGGTFVGDVYVETNKFILKDATVEGNVYFATEEALNTFDSSGNGKVTGVTEVKK
ncbi:hypothetical protein PAT3040_04784 [Paenibacillus agaridevorans]|jgi:hypothetical protein|uniref:Lipoprotein n=1 Tax=Paenibacillus agaridevorans TaxID=171404 RepID=A0A2R5F2P4_9BACL|nr:hypothetical protein [Paenibacillus agaridevorans]GBG10074.1 hypothetical protein PAT3040_04784 [Paenibacillus agaridevorans]